MTGAPVVLNNIDRDGIILAENGAFLRADCDEYEYEEEVQDGGDDNEESSSDDESFIADEPIISEASTLTEEAPFLAPPARTAAVAQAPAPRAAGRPQVPQPFALLAAAAAPPAATFPAAAAPPAPVPLAPPASSSSNQGEKGKKAAANAIPAALVEAAIESVAAVADGSAPKISLQKKKEGFQQLLCGR